jgi:hypothetical protein
MTRDGAFIAYSLILGDSAPGIMGNGKVVLKCLVDFYKLNQLFDRTKPTESPKKHIPCF